MQCAIEIDTDYNGPSVFTAKDPKARKAHTCYECNGEIKPGDVYRHESGIWDGDPSTYKTCADCLSVRKALFCGYEYGRLWELLDEHIQESGGEILTSSFEAMTPGARESVFDMIESYWEEFYTEHPTQPAVRFTGKIESIRNAFRWKSLPEWMQRRQKEIREMDSAILVG